MQTQDTFAQGTVVRFTGKNLGTMLDPDGYTFSEHICHAGDRGLYYGPHPALPHWHIVSFAHEGRTLYVPVAASQFEAA